MSGAVKAVKNVFSGGGNSPGLAGTGRFKASTRAIDKGAFKIKESEEASKRARKRETESAERSKQAAADRRSLIESLQAQAAGEGPSLAEAQLKSASERSLAQQLAAAQSQRGGSAAARERQLMRGQAQAGRELAQDAATARLQERESAQRQLGEQIGQEQQLADQLTQNYLSQGFNIEQARQQALADYEKLQTDQFLSAQGANLSGFQSSAAARGQLFGGLMQGGAAAFMSDKRSKKKIKKSSNKDMMKMMKSMSDENSKSKMKKVEVENKKPSSNKKSLKEFLKEDKSSSGREKVGKAIGFALGSALKSKDSKSVSDENTKIEKRESKDIDIKKHIKEPAPAPKIEKKQGIDPATAAKLAPLAASALSDKSAKMNSKSYSDKSSKMNAYSDKNIKKDFLDKLEAYTYEYKDKYKKDPRAGEGRHMSVMAQDLEKAGPIGKNMVDEDVDGVKMVNYAKGYGAVLAAQAHLNKRLNQLEKKLKKGKK